MKKEKMGGRIRKRTKCIFEDLCTEINSIEKEKQDLTMYLEEYSAITRMLLNIDERIGGKAKVTLQTRLSVYREILKFLKGE